ncbi:TRAP transporter substrate-binding protein [Stappia sp.]|uniref:TRAP transporter substrate-binding protein n=1 Tax=Stappia sp. TaxID=1870903 RepID=UPI0032D982DE
MLSKITTSARRVLGAGAMVAGLLAGTALPATAQEVTLRVHQFLPLQAAIPSRAIAPWIEAVEAQSDGRIKVEHYPSMQLGGAPPALFDQARDGVVDIVWTLLGYTPGRFPKTEAFELPFLGKDAESSSRAFHEFVETHAMDEFAGVKPLAFHVHGPGLLHVSGDGVSRLEDMEGLKLRGPTRIVTRLLGELGATAIGMPVPAVPEAISKGVIDGAVIPWEVTLPLKMTELVNTHTGFDDPRGLYTATFVFAMNQAKYDALPDDLKAVIDANSGPEAAALFGRAMDEVDAIGKARAEEAGNTIRMLSPEETARWKAAAQRVTDDWIAEMDGRGLDGQALAEAARALVDKHAGE